MVPFIADRSEWQTPVAMMRTRTLPAPTGGVVTSSRASSLSSPTLCRIAAFTNPAFQNCAVSGLGAFEEQRALRARVDRLTSTVEQLTVRCLDEDVQVLVVIEVEDLRGDADADCVGLALIG